MMKTQFKKHKLFYLGLLVFTIGVVLVFAGYNVPSPIANPTYQEGNLTYFFPFANYLSIGGVVVAVAALFMERKRKSE
jgi:cell division protein FtsX